MGENGGVCLHHSNCADGACIGRGLLHEKAAREALHASLAGQRLGVKGRTLSRWARQHRPFIRPMIHSDGRSHSYTESQIARLAAAHHESRCQVAPRGLPDELFTRPGTSQPHHHLFFAASVHPALYALVVCLPGASECRQERGSGTFHTPQGLSDLSSTIRDQARRR